MSKNPTPLRSIAPPLLFLFLDYVGVVLSEHLAFILRDALDTWNRVTYLYGDAYIYGAVPLLFIIFLGQSRSYRQMKPVVDTMRDIFQSVFAGWMASIIIIYFLKASDQSSRLFIILFGLFVLVNVCLIRYCALKFMKRRNIFYEPIILIGAGLTAERLIKFWREDLGYRYKVVGLIDDHPISATLPKEFPILGGFDEARRIIRAACVKTVIIAAPGLGKERLQALISDIQPHVKNISFVPDLIGTPMSSVELSLLFSEKILLLNLRNNLSRPYNRVIKRIFDLTLTIVGGLMISPILLAIALAVAIDNRGHVIFAHKRVGAAGKKFPCYKFQTMIPDAEAKLKEYLAENPEARREWEETFKLTHDPRVTKLGNFLRRTSLDELPQLWNVIRGEMSLVGPRPIVQAEVVRYGKNIREYYMVLPGITGMWQVSGRSDTTYPERVAMDTWYVRNWSVWIDLMYLFKTVKAVFKGKGAY
ncbi:MAG: undecaprenyl-phosphate galactose phosphotransferase WbaP [Selenomonadaceae bacterium]|nr:undecaprenyl-phosphate galactose phosphotransferase WbaP [Selenomonadaceae bacterium]MBR0103820.1 undecaprenyl-phosphate galactose phosphotransferase WbaP [Selenomonadaceae bacterium]